MAIKHARNLLRLKKGFLKRSRGQATILWFPICLILAYLTVWGLMSHSSNAALEHVANSVMQTKCDCVMNTLQSIDTNGKALMDNLLESLAVKSGVPPEIDTRIRTILTAVTPPGYVASFVVEGANNKFEVRTGTGELRYQRIYEVTFGEIGSGLEKARVFVLFYECKRG